MLRGTKHRDKIRVGFILQLSAEWFGGVNYFRNLLNLIHDNDDLQIEPVLFLPCKMDEKLLRGYPKVETVMARGMDRYTLPWLFSRSVSKLFHREIYWEKMVRKYRIDVLSHCTCWVSNAKVISWIPDFQHKYLPELFTTDELKARDDDFAEIASRADIVLLSSENAKNDFSKFYPEYAYKARVYRFMVPVEHIEYNVIDLYERYGIKGKYYFIPNQFWIHKNHNVVIEALHFLRKNGHNDIKVVCSGNTDDYRNHNYFDELMQRVKEYDLTEQFVVVGKIPYSDVQALMQECHSLINPSLFEGWSTMVEEAKSMGKAIILSDLNVHKEQNPAGGMYFKRNDYRDLADKMLEMWNKDEDYLCSLKKNAPRLMRSRAGDAIGKYRDVLESSLC